MKIRFPKIILLFGLATLMGARGSIAETTSTADQPQKLPSFEVTAPKFTSPLMEFYEKFDSLFDSPWIDAQGGALIQAIIWRHGYVAVHPSEEAVILVHRSYPYGRVADATTIYTKEGKLYANSYALGEHVRLRGLSAADIHDTKRIEQAIGGIQDVYALDASMAVASFRAGGWVVARSAFNPVMGDFTAGGAAGMGNDTGQVVPLGLNIFYPGSMVVHRGGISSSWGAGPGYPPAYWGDRFHKASREMLDAVYRALHDPGQSGVVPVALNQVDLPRRTMKGTVTQATPAIVFDWEGVHYVYKPYGGTVGHEIPRNVVTGLPYLCVQDSGFLESVYFCASFLRSHPGEKAVVVAGDSPSAAYTVNGKLCLFSPALSRIALLKALKPDAIGDPQALKTKIEEMKAGMAALPAPSAMRGRAGLQRVPASLDGDTADLQMRRIYVAFEKVGIPVHLKSGETSSVSFTWQGVDYVYGSDQRIRRASNG